MAYLSLRRHSAVVLALAAGIGVAHGADVNGRIKGTVTDPTGAVLPNVPVVATNQATGIKYPTTSQSDGAYIFQQLPVGTYTVTASAPGFKTFEATGIIITIDQEYVEAIKLDTGSAAETVEVAADAVQVNTTDMQLNNIVNSSQMVELPLIGRSFTGLELTLPGVQASSDRFGTYSVSGAETQQSSFLINGADTNDIALNSVALTPNLDAIDQFNLIEGPLNAEYDRNSGGIVSATIKQGTNHIHGDAFEFYRDTFLNTGNYFSYILPTPTKAGYKNVTPYHQNIFGGTIGAPILRDKLFVFGGYQGTRQRVPGTNGGGSTNVFSSAQLGGDFSADVAGRNAAGYTFAGFNNPIPGTLKIGSCPAATTWGQCITANGGKFNPATDFNTISKALVAMYVPAANSGSNGYVFNSVTATTANQYIGRFDYSLSPKNQFTFLGIYQHQVVNSNIPFTGASLPGFGETDTQTIQQYTFDYVRQLSASAVNDFAAHYTRFNYQAVLPQTTQAPSASGFSITPQNSAASSLPTISTGYFTLGFSTNGPQPRVDQVYQLDDNFSKSLGHHQLKFGYDGRRFQVSNPFNANNSGSYGFSNAGTYSTGDPGLDFLLGNSNSYAQGSGAEIQAYAFLNYLYAQDTWKFTDTFTFSYGLGYQIDTPLHNIQYGGEAVTCFIPGQQSKVFATAPTGINYPGDPGCTNASLAKTHYGDFGPRIGFAYAPNLGLLSDGSNKKLSIRGGFGLYYDRTEEETSLNNLQTPPFGQRSSGAVDYGAKAPAFGNPYVDINTGATYANKFPFVFPTPGATINFAKYEPLILNNYAPNFRSPYAENFQLSVERELPSHIIARVSYVASLGHHNQNTYEGSPITQTGHNTCLADTVNCGSPYSSGVRNLQSYYYPSHTAYGIVDPNTGLPAFPSIGVVGTEGASNFNSLQASVQKAPTHGLQFQLSYTLGHALDNASSYENSGYGSSGRGYNQYVPSLNYGNSSYDARQRLVFSPIYIVPFKTSGSAFSLTNLALGGWQVSGIMTVATGFPFDVSYSGSSSNSLWCSPSVSFYACPDEPNIVGPLVRSNPRTKIVTTNAAGVSTTNNYTQWYTPSTATFTQAPLGQFGNAGRNPFHGPGINNTNLILAKNIALSADGVRKLQLRMESDNVFNHTQFSNPASSFTSGVANVKTGAPATLSFGTAGRITSAAAARQTQLAAKFYF
jgi:hypothetical protein